MKTAVPSFKKTGNNGTQIAQKNLTLFRCYFWTVIFQHLPHKHQKSKITIVMLETVVAWPAGRARCLDRASWYAWHTHQAASRFHHRKSPNSTGEITLISCPRRRCDQKAKLAWHAWRHGRKSSPEHKENGSVGHGEPLCLPQSDGRLVSVAVRHRR